MTQVAIIGGGAAGLAAALASAEYASKRGMQAIVSIYETDDKVGRSILRSGNGRCNFSNLNLNCTHYTNMYFVRDVLDEFKPYQTLRFLEKWGLTWQEESEGRLYPTSRKASSVRDVLVHATDEMGVNIFCDARVVEILPPNKKSRRWALRMEDGSFERADAVVLAIGGHDGLDLVPSVVRTNPFEKTLGPIKTSGPSLKVADNVRAKADLTLIPQNMRERERLHVEQGEVMFRKYGISGIAAFNISRWTRPGDIVRVNLFPQIPIPAFRSYLSRRAEDLALIYDHLSVLDIFMGMLAEPVARVVCSAAQLNPAMNVYKMTNDQMGELARCTNQLDLTVVGIGDESLSQVSRGGVCVDQINPKTMEVESLPGFYVAGEAIDVDGPCGGYNLHWAWTSGILAGRAAMAR